MDKYHVKNRLSRTDKPETLATLGTTDTGPKQHKTQKTQHRKLKDEQHGPHQKNPGVNAGAAPNVVSVSGLSILDRPFRFSLRFICPVSCVPNVASVSGLSIHDQESTIQRHWQHWAHKTQDK
jgi:hypothetical protein